METIFHRAVRAKKLDEVLKEEYDDWGGRDAVKYIEETLEEQRKIDFNDACEILSIILGVHLHGGEIDEVIAEFEEEMNK